MSSSSTSIIYEVSTGPCYLFTYFGDFIGSTFEGIGAIYLTDEESVLLGLEGGTLDFCFCCCVSSPDELLEDDEEDDTTFFFLLPPLDDDFFLVLDPGSA